MNHEIPICFSPHENCRSWDFSCAPHRHRRHRHRHRLRHYTPVPATFRRLHRDRRRHRLRGKGDLGCDSARRRAAAFYQVRSHHAPSLSVRRPGMCGCKVALVPVVVIRNNIGNILYAQLTQNVSVQPRSIRIRLLYALARARRLRPRDLRPPDQPADCDPIWPNSMMSRWMRLC
jgi:hypothetical protein